MYPFTILKPAIPKPLWLSVMFSVVVSALLAGQDLADKPFTPQAPVLTPKSVSVKRVSGTPAAGRLVVLKMPATPTDGDIGSFQGMIEPLRPVSPDSTVAERTALSTALNAWQVRPVADEMSVLEGFIQTYPDSAWVPSLRLNLGRYYYNTGHFSKAIAEWDAAWNFTKDMSGAEATAIANAAVAESAVMMARIGRKDELSALLASVATRTFQGSTLTLLERAREGLWSMENRPGISFRCGPYALELIHIKTHGQPVAGFMDRVVSPAQGFSLTELKAMARDELGTPMQVAKRTPGATLILPSVVHWKVGHYGALMREQGGAILLRDPTFGNDTWMTQAAIDTEGSGYFLVPVGPLPAGWATVADLEAATVYGKGHSGNTDGDETTKCSKKSGSTCPNTHMAGYSFHTLLTSLNISDVPVGYSPAYGPDVNFEAIYNMREYGQPTAMNFTNLSPLWENGWTSYLEDNPALPAADIRVNLRGGGAETHTGYTETTPTTGTFGKNRRWDTVLVRTGSGTYERRQPDGSKEIYAQAIGTTGPNRKVFLSQIVDPQGNAVSLVYSTTANLTTRLDQIIDATGLVTTLTYGEAGYPFLVTKVTDPFARFATFTYQTIAGEKRLQKITDTIGIESAFEYNASGQITALITPYGRTTFDFGTPNTAFGLIRWIQATDPQGAKERIEYHLDGNVTGIPYSEGSPNQVPVVAGISFEKLDMDDRNTFYWSKKAWAMAPGDYSKAHLQHWLQIDNADRATGVLESEKAPFENRVWYRYPGQSSGDSMNMGTSSQPSITARVIENESSPGGTTTQVTRHTYNALGNPISMIDPAGRESSIEYDTNGIDPTFVKQKVNGVFQTLQSFTYDPTYPAHRPKIVTDAAGQTVTLTYNSVGQVKTITNALNETTTLTYGTTTSDPLRPKGLVYLITGPQPGSDLTLTYDGYQRPRTVTDSSGHTTTYDYDVFDRITLVTHPDNTTEQNVYDRLDLFAQKDRQGRWTRTWHNSLRQPMLTADALGRTIGYGWCKCGAMSRLTDAKGQITSWKHDAQSRLTGKTYPDGRTESLAYEPFSGRLSTTTDAAGQIKTMKYNPDDSLKNLGYSNLASGTAATAGVSYTYDPYFPRPVTMTDGTGITLFDYYSAGQLGALMPKTTDGPLTGTTDLITLTYDALGRQKTTNIGATGTENLVTRNFDSLGRIQSIINSLGTFTHSYVGATDRPDHIDYPYGQKTSFGYFGNTGDNRLQTITHLASGSNPASVLSKFDYYYQPDGNINNWQRQFGSDPATALSLGYDLADQLTSATLAPVAAPASVTRRYSYQYDKAGNRTSSQGDNQVTSATHNNANQITSMVGGGKLLVTGTTNEPAKIKVNGQSATTTPPPENLYQAWVQVTPGANTLTIEATDYAPTPNTSTQSWNVNITGNPARSFTYDLNGNTLTDGTGKSYVWDAENRLVKITQGTNIHEFIYDGMSRRVAEKLNGTLTKRLLWNGTQIAEQRDATGNTVQLRYYSEGEKRIGGTDAGNYYYTRDHLGSIREMTDTSATVRARYDYDPYGKRTKLSGDLECDFAFTGHYYHAANNLHLALFRAYDQDSGRWLSTDPLESVTGEMAEMLPEGTNLYGYVGNNPISEFDELGLWQFTIYGGEILGGYFTIGKNSGQWNFGARIGVGGGLSASLDVKDSGCRPEGLGAAIGIDVAAGAGVIGGNAGASMDSKQGDTLYLGGRIGPIGGTKSWTNNNSFYEADWSSSWSGGVTNYGAAGFGGVGISYAGKCPP